jgi:hypothetical protein
MGPTPKPPGQRRRRNLTAPAWRTLPAHADLGVPAMPSPSPRRRWSRAAVEAWREWWSSPTAAVWIEADAVSLRRALKLVDDLAVGRSFDHVALTALEDRLGLSPKSRRALAWEVERAQPAPVVVLVDARHDPRQG